MRERYMVKSSRLDIDRIALFGRTYDEYLRMFDLSENPSQESEPQ